MIYDTAFFVYAYLNKMNNDDQITADDINLTQAQQKEIIKRDNDFVSEKTMARDWADVKRDLEAIYNDGRN